MILAGPPMTPAWQEFCRVPHPSRGVLARRVGATHQNSSRLDQTRSWQSTGFCSHPFAKEAKGSGTRPLRLRGIQRKDGRPADYHTRVTEGRDSLLGSSRPCIACPLFCPEFGSTQRPCESLGILVTGVLGLSSQLGRSRLGLGRSGGLKLLDNRPPVRSKA